MKRFLLASALTITAILAAQTPAALRKHVEYLASDKLRGRNIPSAGLDLAADYIAGQFKEIGLEAASGGGDFFQTYRKDLIRTNYAGWQFVVRDGEKRYIVHANETLAFSSVPLRLDNVELIKIDPEDGPWLKSLRPADVKGKVFIVKIATIADGEEKQDNFSSAVDIVAKLSPALILMTSPTAAALEVPGTLLEPGDVPPNQVPRFPVRTDALRARLDSLAAGPTGMSVTLHLAAPIRDQLKLRNVAGIVRGSDADSYIVVTANYDGFPPRRIGDDPVNNSANTNASGVAALIEAARQLAKGPRPKRSILFVAISGEPPDGPGQKFYREHPLVPLEKTIASITLAQLGRTDSIQGVRLKSAAISAFKDSPLPATFADAAKASGVTFYDDPDHDVENMRGLAATLTATKVPSHTIYVTVYYPDLRKVSDEAGKLDYSNMSLITRAIAAGLLAAANH